MLGLQNVNLLAIVTLKCWKNLPKCRFRGVPGSEMVKRPRNVFLAWNGWGKCFRARGNVSSVLKCAVSDWCPKKLFNPKKLAVFPCAVFPCAVSPWFAAALPRVIIQHCRPASRGCPASCDQISSTSRAAWVLLKSRFSIVRLLYFYCSHGFLAFLLSWSYSSSW